MTLHLIQLCPDVPRLVRWATAQGVLPREGEDHQDQADHQQP